MIISLDTDKYLTNFNIVHDKIVRKIEIEGIYNLAVGGEGLVCWGTCFPWDPFCLDNLEFVMATFPQEPNQPTLSERNTEYCSR